MILFSVEPVAGVGGAGRPIWFIYRDCLHPLHRRARTLSYNFLLPLGKQQHLPPPNRGTRCFAGSGQVLAVAQGRLGLFLPAEVEDVSIESLENEDEWRDGELGAQQEQGGAAELANNDSPLGLVTELQTRLKPAQSRDFVNGFGLLTLRSAPRSRSRDNVSSKARTSARHSCVISSACRSRASTESSRFSNSARLLTSSSLDRASTASINLGAA